MLANKADEGVKPKKEREAGRGSIVSHRGEIRAKQNRIAPEGEKVRKEKRACKPKRRQWARRATGGEGRGRDQRAQE